MMCWVMDGGLWTAGCVRSHVQIEHTFQREVAAVYVVAQEEVSCRARVAAHLEQLDQVEELPVYIAHNRDGGRHVEYLCRKIEGREREKE